MKIEGSASIKYTICQSSFYIDEIKIHNLKEILPPDFSILSNKNGEIVFFETMILKEEPVIEKCVFIYKMGFGVKKYELVENEKAISDFIIFNNKKYTIEQFGVHHKFNKVYFHDNKFIYEQVENKSTNEYEILFLSESVKQYEQNIYQLLSSIKFTNLYSIFEFILTDGNINKLYFIFYNREDIIDCYIIDKYYHTFYNIFLYTGSHIKNFTICSNTKILLWENNKISLQSYCKLSIKIYRKILIQVINNILLEHQIVLYSNSPNKIFNLIIFLINSIQPFNFNYYINSNLHIKNIDLLEMPFPFLIGLSYIPPKIKNNIVFVNLDEGNIKNIFKTVLPFKSKLLRYLKEGSNEEIFKKYFDIIKNNIDIARENCLKEALIKENEEDLKQIIYNPRKIFKSNIKMKFFTYFSNTQIFHEYLGRRLKCTSSHIFSVNSMKYLNIYTNDVDINIYVYKIILLIYPESADDVFFTIKDNKELLPALLENIIFAYSLRKNFKNIFYLYRYMIEYNIPFQPKYFKAITFANNFISPINISKISIEYIKIENGFILVERKKYRLLKSEYVFCKLLDCLNENNSISDSTIYYNCFVFLSLVKIESLTKFKLPKILLN